MATDTVKGKISPMIMGVRMRCLLVLLALVQFYSLAAQAEVIHNTESVRTAARHYLGSQIAATYPDSTAEITVGSVDERMNLSECPTPSLSLAAGSHLWGTGSIGVRCEAPANWNLYLSYSIRLKGPALLAQRPLPSHYAPTARDLTNAEVEYKSDPGRYPRNPDNLHGATLTMPVAKGTPITIDLLRVKPLIQAGQRVQIRSGGDGFVVSQEGIAQQQAGVGELLRLKLASGRYVQGIVQDDGTVYIKP
jgi:flagella basal body P-ring formation protein FlgA